MFDLFRSRATAVRYLLGGLLGLVALSMVITLIPGFGSGVATRGDDNVLAEIGKTRLTVRDVQNKVQQLVRSRQVPSELISVYLPQRLDQMIMERAVAYEAERRGFEVPDSELASTIRSILPRFFQDGKLIDKAGYEQFLQEQGYTIPEFESNLRKQIQMKRLMDLALEGIVVTPDEVKQEFERKNAKVKIAYVGFKPDSLKAQVKLTPEDLQTYFNSNKDSYREPEKHDVVVLVADQDKIAASLTITDEQLRRAYDQNKDAFRSPERAKVRHILLMTQGKTPDEANKIKAKAERLLKQANNSNFAELAKTNSEDPGSKDKGGDLGWVVRGQMVKNFENASFNQKVGEISPALVQTEYGYHIVQVQEREAARLKPFDEVKAQLATDAKRQMVADRTQSSIDQARAALAKTPAAYEQVAQQFGLEVVKATDVAPGAPVGSLGTVAELDQALAGLKPNEASQVFQLSPTRLGVGEVTKITPSRPATFAESEAKVRETLLGMKAQALAAERGQQAAQRVKAGEDLAKVARELGGELKTPAEFNAEGAIEGLGAASSLGEAFTKPVGSILGPLSIIGQQVVVKVVEKTPADPAMLAAQREQIVLALKQKKSTERRELFQDSILAQLLKEGKVKKHNEAIKRLIAAYRG